MPWVVPWVIVFVGVLSGSIYPLDYQKSRISVSDSATTSTDAIDFRHFVRMYMFDHQILCVTVVHSLVAFVEQSGKSEI